MVDFRILISPIRLYNIPQMYSMTLQFANLYNTYYCNALVVCLTGVTFSQDDKLVLLLTSTELLHDTFLTCLYEFVKDSAISHLFSCEERSRIISAVRSDLTPAGLVFSTETAWRYFIELVMCCTYGKTCCFIQYLMSSIV